MLRLVVFLVGIAVVATGLSWLADRPGSIVVNWQGYEMETSVFKAVVAMAAMMGLAVFLWSLVSALWRSPAALGAFFNRRRQMRGLEALSGGMIAIGAGDRTSAMRYAVQARKALPNEPMTHLLRAQAAQLSGDRPTARRMYEAMLSQPETEQVGLRGLFEEAVRERELEAARQFAERSVEINPSLPWAVDALFDLHCKNGDWADALKMLTIAKQHHHLDKPTLDRRRAVLMTARALALEEAEPGRALNLAIDAHHLAHELIPAAALAGRMLAARGQTKRAAKIIERTWRRAPHPDLALVYAHLRIGDSPRDRLDRVKRLAQLNPHSIETPIAIGTAAIEARDWSTARRTLELLAPSRMTQRVCMLMARLESDENADKGKAREWLARAVHAPRDPAWVADGVVADKWAPVSPRTGAFDAYEWRVPADALDVADSDVLAAKLDEMVKLSAPASRPAHEADRIERDRVYDPEVVTAEARTGPQARVERGESRTGASPPSAAPRPQVEEAAIVTASHREAPKPRPVRAEPRAAPSGNGRPAAAASTVEVVSGPARATRNDTVGSTAAQRTGGERKPLEPDMFIAPRAPDDAPAPPAAETDTRPPPRAAAGR